MSYNLGFSYELRKQKLTLCEKCPNTEFFFGPYFPAFGQNTERYSVFSPNTRKYGPEKTPYLDAFHAVLLLRLNTNYIVLSAHQFCLLHWMKSSFVHNSGSI